MSTSTSAPAATPETSAGAGDDRTSLPWAAIPRYVPGVTDTTEYGKKLKFLAEVWPKEHLSSLAPRVALLCEGSAFKKIARLDAAKLKVADTTGVELIVKTLGGAWGQTILEEKYEQFEKAIFGTVQRSDETHDSYLARHDIHFEELLAQNITFEELRSYVLLRQSQLSSDDKKRIVVEHGGKLTYEKVKSSIRLLGSRFFGEFQGQRANPRTKVYDANTLEEFYAEEPEKAFQATATSSNPSLDENEGELEPEFLEAMAAQEDSDALQVQSFEEELEGYFQETPDLQEALVSYLEARSRLLAKKKSRGFWPVGGSGKGGGKGGRGFKGGKGRGKSGREQLLARISRSVCRACGEKGHWKAECPKFGRPGSMSGKGEATTTVAEVLQETYDASATSTSGDNAVLTTVPEEAFSLEEAFIATCTVDRDVALRNLKRAVQKIKARNVQSLQPSPHRLPSAGKASLTDPESHAIMLEPASRKLKRSFTCTEPPKAMALVASETVKAILDTGASCCVMGKQLLPAFLRQLSDATRQQVKVTSSSVRFRFGNNQTLTSEQRVLLPVKAGHHQVLWLGVEIVPGGTPLLFSKRAIKQLGGIIDTTQDRCHLERLQKSLSLTTGPTGLYMVDLARLCEESDQEQQCQHACEDRSLSTPCTTPPVHAQKSLNPCPTSSGCIDRSSVTPFPKDKNSYFSGFRKYTVPVNASVQMPKSNSVSPSAIVNKLCPESAATATLEVNPPVFDKTLPPRCAGHVDDSQAQSRRSVCSPHRPNGRAQHGAASSYVRARAGRFPSGFRPCHERPKVSRCGRERVRLGEVDAVSHDWQREKMPSHLLPLSGEVHSRGRDDRRRSPWWRSSERSRPRRAHSAEHEGPPKEQSRPSQRSDGLQFQRSRSVGCHRRDIRCRSAARQSGDGHGDPSHSAGTCDGASAGCFATDHASSSSSVSCKPACAVQEVRIPPRFTIAVASIEPQARSLVQQGADVCNIRNFLKKVPWNRLQETSTNRRTVVQASPDSSNKPTAYLTFGMYMHGGVVGVTKLSLRYPWLTRALARMLVLSDSTQTFTSIGVSCNSQTSPHRDKYNSSSVPNMVVAFEVPSHGGEVWTAVDADSSSKNTVSLSCDGKSIPGILHSLSRGAVYLNPREWHATMDWTGNRSILIGYVLKHFQKLPSHQISWLKRHGFNFPRRVSFRFNQTASEGSTGSKTVAFSNVTLCNSEDISPLALAAQTAASESAAALERAEALHRQSQMLLSPPQESTLDLLEIGLPSDSRLTAVVLSLGGQAKRFTREDGDLRSPEGQQRLWQMVQETQPRHIWFTPEGRHWSAWSSLNAARSSQQHQAYAQSRSSDQVLFQLCVELCDWQKQRHRDFHLELPGLFPKSSVSALQTIARETYKASVDMCSFGLQTPKTGKPIKKRILIQSTSQDITKSLATHVCNQMHVHQTLSGRTLKGLPMSQFAGSYCEGFAQHVARVMLARPADSALAADSRIPLTRKRFKTSVGPAVPVEQPVSLKRSAEDNAEGSQRSLPVRRSESTLLHMSELSAEVWQPVFDLAARCAQQANALIAPQSHLAKGIQEALDLHSIEVLQAFVGKKIRNLQSPLGALPVTVAPVRVSLGQRSATNQLLCLGNEDRSTMSAERKKLRVGVHEILITVFGRKRGPPAAAERANPPDDVPGGSGESQSMRPDLEGWAPPPTPTHGPAFRNLDKAAKSQLVRIHNNLGHPSPETLAKHLKAAGEDPALVQAALDYQCDACLESTEPRHQRPSKLPEVLEFNDLLGVDGFFFKGRSGYRAYVLHALDEASCFHLGRRALSRGTKHATTTLAELWFSWAGNPRKVYLDPAGEFRSEEILDHFQSLNVRTFVTAAAWQRGRLERHGDIVKDMLTRLDTQSPLVNDELFDQALLQAFQAKNALVRHRGYAPEQIVLGKSLRVPGSNSSDEDLGAHSVLEGADLEAELQRQRLDVRCRARQVFWEADNNQTIRRALLRRSNPVRGPYKPGDWVLYWMRKGSPNRLAAGRWHGPARVISQEGQSITWISHGTIILRCAPENLRPASLREWQQLSASDQGEITRNAGGASSFIDLTGVEATATAPAPPRSLATGEIPVPVSITVPPNGPPVPPADDDIAQPEQELTPQVSHNPEDPAVVREVERAAGPLPSSAAPSSIPNSNLDATSAPPEPAIPGDPAMLESVNIPVPDSDDGLIVESGSPFVLEEALCGETVLMASSDRDCGLSTFLTVQPGTPETSCPPLAEDNLPYVEQPLFCHEHQAFCLEIPLKAKDLKRWTKEKAPEQLSYLASVSKRARSEVSVKDLTSQELQLFEKAKEKEIQCWIQTSAIKAVLRRRLNPEQILRSRWILTWKSPEPGEDQRRAKARLVVLGFQDPKLVDVMRDAPTLSKEGRALVLQTISSMKYELSSFDIKTAFLRGKADENNPLAMEPPRELRQALGLQEDEVCQLLGNAYGRVDAPLLFYKELSQQLYQLGFIRHPLEPCVFLLYTGTVLNGILGVHVDDGVCGGDTKFSQKIQALQSKLPFGSRKHRNFVFTGIHLEQFPDYSIRASQGEYVRNIQQIDIGRARRMLPEATVTEDERSKLRGLIGSMQYAVTHTRPDMAAKLGEIQGQVTKATVQTLLSANKVLRETQEQAEVCIYFLPISPQELTFVSFGDASFASSKNLNSHQGAIVCATDSRLNKNVEAPLSPLVWTSKKIPRVVRSTLSAEAYAMSKAVDMLGWMRALWGVVHVPDFSWQRPEEGYKKLNTAIIVTDCKSLFDLVTRLAMPACEEHRTTLEVLLIKQRCAENATFRWIPTTLQAADCLTKAMDSTLLRTVLSQGRFKLYDTSKTLEKDAQRRQAIAWLSQPSQLSP